MKRLIIFALCILLMGCEIEVRTTSETQDPPIEMQYNIITPMKAYYNVTNVCYGMRFNDTCCQFDTEDGHVRVYGTFIIEYKEI